MNRIQMLILLFATCTRGFAQVGSPMGDTLYFDQAHNAVKNRNDAAYFRLPPQNTDSGYRLKDFYKDGRVAMVGYATASDGFIRTGHTISYDPLGFPTEEGFYKKGMKQGDWNYYFIGSGYVKNLIHYQNDAAQGPALYYDSLTHTVSTEGMMANGYAEGEWKSYYRSSRSLYKLAYYHNQHTDSVKLYYPNGRLKRVDYVKNGEVQKNSVCYDSTGKKVRYYEYTTNPLYKKAQIQKWMKESFVCNEHKDTLIYGKGLLQISFTIDESGRPADKKIDSVTSTETRQLAQCLIDHAGVGTPATYDGRPVAMRVVMRFTGNTPSDWVGYFKYIKDEQDIIEGK